MNTKRAVQFGAGNIGRGFLGQLYFETGYETTYVDVVQETIDALNARHEYPLRIVDESITTLTISGVSALHASNVQAVAEALAGARLASTAVGVPILPKIAPVLAAGIARRFQNSNADPLNIIVCENMLNAGPFLREQVRAHLAPEFHDALDRKVGFVEASIGRMVPAPTPETRAEDPLLICVEAFCDLPVDRNGFKGPVPELKNLQLKDKFGAYVERKLFVHNAGHAVTAYLGYIRGHEFIWQAIADDEVTKEVAASLAESCAALVAKHGLDPVELKAHADDILRRFHNRYLGDPVARVAKDPIRKLGPNDRLIGAALTCLASGVKPAHLAFAAAAAMRYDHPDDPAALTLKSVFREDGIAGVLTQYCRVPMDSPLARLIIEGFHRLQREGWLDKN
ncbi:MAG: mannitol-1-phosphate 5-dehydrogenase [Candidatus Hydrogenedentes bacterium]|nr:mannitol-1-phosphate 5-dehydrogenase [Candidatus Hydrogenedentota bacterium]